LKYLDSKNKINLAARAAFDKKADRIVIMEMKEVFPICDYFLIASGDSTRKVLAIADNIQKKLFESGIKHWHLEGKREGQWVLLDYSDIVIHIFLSKLREFYDLERLWGDAPKITFDKE